MDGLSVAKEVYKLSQIIIQQSYSLTLFHLMLRTSYRAIEGFWRFHGQNKLSPPKWDLKYVLGHTFLYLLGDRI